MRVCLCNYRTLLLLRETQLEQLRVQGGGVSFVFHVARQTTGIAVSSFASAVKHSLTSVNSDLSLLALNRRPFCRLWKHQYEVFEVTCLSVPFVGIVDREVLLPL